MVVNYMEEIVKNYLKQTLKNDPTYRNICTCDQCVDDIMAKTLNNIKPYYITTKTGEIYAEYSSLATQNHAEVITEVIKAIEFISNHKSHE